MAEEAQRLVVGRLRKPHGLKGEVALFPLTDTPDQIFVPGRRLALIDMGGSLMSELEVERSRAFHREWLVKFKGLDSRSQLDQLAELRGLFVAVPAAELPAPADGEVYYHELVGFAAKLDDGTPVGLVSDFYELPSGLTLEIQGPKREFLLPFVKEFVGPIDRELRQLTIRLPEGLLDE